MSLETVSASFFARQLLNSPLLGEQMFFASAKKKRGTRVV
jgi:hypothetical protein